jgi:putative ABC transport system permease protein
VTSLHLVRAGLARKKARTLFTFLSIAVAFVLFAFLAAIRLAFSLGVEVTGDDRLLAIHKVSLIQPLPLAYQERIVSVPGVRKATHATWFGGKYQNEENPFAVFPVVPEEYLELYPEFVLDETERERWFADRRGAVVGRTTAERFDLEVGDRLPIQGTIYRLAGGGDTWEFTVAGIYEGAESGVDETQVLIDYDYFNEARDEGRDLVGWYIIQVADPGAATAVARAIDQRFANSSYETETMPEKAFVQNFAAQIGNVGAILRAVLTAVFFTILLVAGNTMAQSVRERTSELAVLKTLGFADGRVLALVLAESLTLALSAGGLGLLAGWAWVTLGGDPTGGRLAVFYVPTGDLVLGAALVVLLGLAAGLLPAVAAMRLRIVDALRRA